MTKARKRKRQGCDVAKAIDKIEEAASTAMEMYKAVEPIVKAILRNWGKIK